MCTGPTSAPVQEGDDEKARRRQDPAAVAVSGVRCASAAAIARTKLTMRGPQRDAIESSTRTIVPVRTAATFFQPGRAATVRGDCSQQAMSASTTMSGLCETTYSAESFG